MKSNPLNRASSSIGQYRWTHPHPPLPRLRGRVGWGVQVGKGEPNAQAEDEVGRKKALQGHCHRKGALRSVGQAPRYDQADHQADPRASRHQGVVQDRRRQDQEILVAERLTAALTIIPAAFHAAFHHLRLDFEGDPPWPASNGALPDTPSTRKSSKPPRAITAGARTRYESPSRRSKRPTNTRFATASAASAPSGRCGFSGSTRRYVSS